MTSLFALKDEVEIAGLHYLRDYISSNAEQNLLAQIDAQNWLTDLKRRVQHYGYRYDYKARAISIHDRLGDLPQWLQDMAEKLCDDGFFSVPPDQVIVNEYLPGQGIAAHIDCEPCFGEVIASLSLGSPCVMQFCNINSGDKQDRLLQNGSLLLLSGDARYQWTHAIAPRKSDMIDGQKITRQRRVSLTFRQVIL